LLGAALAWIAIGAPAASANRKTDLPGLYVDVRVLHVALPGGGQLTSVVAICETMDLVDDPNLVCGNSPDTKTNRVTSQIRGRPAGERWTVTLVRGRDCPSRGEIVKLPSLSVGSDGRRTVRLRFDATTADAVIETFHDDETGSPGTLTMAMSSGTFRGCGRFSSIHRTRA
jgi:hypothetical protein